MAHGLPVHGVVADTAVRGNHRGPGECRRGGTRGGIGVARVNAADLPAVAELDTGPLPGVVRRSRDPLDVVVGAAPILLEPGVPLHPLWGAVRTTQGSMDVQPGHEVRRHRVRVGRKPPRIAPLGVELRDRPLDGGEEKLEALPVLEGQAEPVVLLTAQRGHVPERHVQRIGRLHQRLGQQSVGQQRALGEGLRQRLADPGILSGVAAERLADRAVHGGREPGAVGDPCRARAGGHHAVPGTGRAVPQVVVFQDADHPRVLVAAPVPQMPVEIPPFGTGRRVRQAEGR